MRCRDKVCTPGHTRCVKRRSEQRARHSSLNPHPPHTTTNEPPVPSSARMPRIVATTRAHGQKRRTANTTSPTAALTSPVAESWSMTLTPFTASMRSLARRPPCLAASPPASTCDTRTWFEGPVASVSPTRASAPLTSGFTSLISVSVGSSAARAAAAEWAAAACAMTRSSV